MAGGRTSREFESRVRTVPAVAEVRSGLGLRNEAVAQRCKEGNCRRNLAAGEVSLRAEIATPSVRQPVECEFLKLAEGNHAAGGSRDLQRTREFAAFAGANLGRAAAGKRFGS